jgi:hypothetical protein
MVQDPTDTRSVNDSKADDLRVDAPAAHDLGPTHNAEWQKVSDDIARKLDGKPGAVDITFAMIGDRFGVVLTVPVGSTFDVTMRADGVDGEIRCGYHHTTCMPLKYNVSSGHARGHVIRYPGDD